MRVYLPATAQLLQQWLAAGEARSDQAFGVTGALREAYREGDQEELEWVATQAAARSCLALLAAAGDGTPSVRVVVAADVDDRELTPPPTSSPAAVALATAVPRGRWAAVLADDPAAAADLAVVRAARQAIRVAGRLDDGQIQDRLDDAEAVELGWWGVQEAAGLLAAAGLAEPGG